MEHKIYDSEKISIKSNEGNFIYVDPGRIFVFKAVRSWRTLAERPAVPKGHTISSRRARRDLHLFNNNESTSQLSGKGWRSMCGQTTADQSIHAWRVKHGYIHLDEQAANYSNKHLGLEDFSQYLRHSTCTWEARWEEKRQPFLRKLRFRRFQSKQRALEKVVRDLTMGRQNCVFVYGKGSVNAPVVKGHPMSPNKWFYRRLPAFGHTVILSSEYRSSQDCPICVQQVWHPKRQVRPVCRFCGCRGRPDGATLPKPCRTKCVKRCSPFSRISCCSSCKVMWDRDLAGARRIKTIFWEKVAV